MRVSIFYFSGTGNTWFVSQQLKSIFIEKGYKAEAYSIEDTEINWKRDLPQILNNSEIIGIGYPVYASTIPQNMKDWVKKYLFDVVKLSKIKKKAFVFDTMALFSGDTPLQMRNLLKECGFSVDQGINIRMLSNLPQIPSLMTWDNEKQEKIFQKAYKKCEKLVESILNNKKWIMRRDPFSRFIGWIQRVGMKLEAKKIRDLYKIDHEKCNLCELCVQYCPVQNLSIESTEHGRIIKYGDDCIYCVRCFNYCPQNAINIMKRTRDTDKYQRFRGQIPNFKLNKIK